MTSLNLLFSHQSQTHAFFELQLYQTSKKPTAHLPPYLQNWKFTGAVMPNLPRICLFQKLQFFQQQLFDMPSSQDKPASFIGKLCNILRSKEHGKIIYWDCELKGIRILNQKKLEEVILPKYYRHNRYSSFVRQLNMYDFHKVHLPEHRSIFLHDTFDPKNKENIHLIRRKVTFQQKSSTDKEQDRNVSEIASHRENNERCDAFLKSSKNMLYKQSIMNFYTEKCSNLQDFGQTQALDELTKELLPLKDKKEQFDQKYKGLKSNKKYRKYFKKSKFRHELSEAVGVNWIQDDDVLSQLSIQDELMFKTKKSLPPKSLRLLESGQIYYRKETFGNIFNL